MEDYVVQFSDTLESIAAKKLGDKNRWREIAQLNNIQNPNELLIGQRLKLPGGNNGNQVSIAPSNQPSSILPDFLNQQIPASIVPAQGYVFVVFEQLPDVGAKNVIRKVAIIPKDFSLIPPNPLANLLPAEHAMGNNFSQFLSSSDKPYGSPTMSKASPTNPNGWKDLLLIDTGKVQASGARIVTVEELVADLQRFAKANPQSEKRISTLIRTVQSVEGEVLIEGSVPGDAVRRLSSIHTAYVSTADEIWARRVAGKITLEQAESELSALSKAYQKAKIVGRVGRVLTVVGVVLTAVDVANAAQKSYERRSYKPLAAETVRQVGGWSGAYAGAIAGAWVGAAFGIETGPGLIITGAIGAIVFGAIGYWRGDVIAGWIDPPEEATTELRKDVRSTDSLIDKGITLTVAPDENQYMFARRALMQAAFRGGLLTDLKQREYADKFYSLRADSEKMTNFQATWEGKDPTPGDGKNVKPTEFNQYRGKQLTYFLNKQEVDELIRLILRGY